MKFILFCCLALLLSLGSTDLKAQVINVNWAEKSRVKFDYEDAVLLDNGNYIMRKSSQHIMQMAQNTLVLLNNSMDVIKEKEIKFDEKLNHGDELRKIGNNIYLFYTAYGFSTQIFTYYALKIDEKTLEIQSKILLGSLKSNKLVNFLEPTYKLSEDSSKLLFFVEKPDYKKENKQFLMSVLDSNLTPIWSQNIDLNIPAKQVDIYDMDISNIGKVFVSLKHYDQDVTKESIRQDGEKIPSYSFKMFVYDERKTKPKELAFALGNKFIQGSKVVCDNSGEVKIAGFYKAKYNGRITGAFYTTVNDKDLTMSKPQVIPIPDDVIALIDVDGYAKTKGDDPGIDEDFVIQYIKKRENGSIDLVAELHEIKTTTSGTAGSSSTSVTYYYGDVLNIHVENNEKPIFTRIPKMQWGTSTYFLGVYPIVYNDKLILLYNDDKDNVEKDISKKPDRIRKFGESILMAGIIDTKGKLTRQKVYSHEGDYVTMPRFISKISDGTYLVMSGLERMFNYRTKYGLMTVK